MLKKINIQDLKEGMYIVNPGDTWLMNPFLYTKEGMVTSDSVIDKILSSGFIEVFIDLERSKPESLPEVLRRSLGKGNETLAEESAKESWSTPLPTTPIGEELAEANRICDDTLSFVRSLLEGNAVEEQHIEAAQPLVEGMLNSLQRNSNALIGLCKLRMSDNYTYTHCVNVAVFTLAFARGLGVSEDKLQAYGLAGLFHDLGKSMVPQEILNAPRKLNDAEFDIMKTHSALGYEQLMKLHGVPREVLEGAHQHHEKYNGFGYPLGLKNDDISMVGRIMSVVDIYDALTSQRVYKPAMPAVKVLGIMYSMREQDFHPGMVENFIRMLGVYPVGSVVELSNGNIGVVSSINNSNGIKPQVAVVKNALGKQYISPIVIELAKEANISINKCVPHNKSEFDIEKILKKVTEMPTV